MDRQGSGRVVITWATMADGDTGAVVKASQYPDKTVQATGDATTVALQGSNDGTNWFALTDPSGMEIGLAGATFDLAMVRENPLYIRPSCTGGSDTDVVVVGQTER
jgi:hypothetical protein